MREGVKEELLREGREERNEGGGRYRGAHGLREGVKEEGKAGRERNEGREASREEHGVMDGVKEEGKVQRERNNGGEAGRGRSWSEGGGEGGLGGREGET